MRGSGRFPLPGASLSERFQEVLPLIGQEISERVKALGEHVDNLTHRMIKIEERLEAMEGRVKARATNSTFEGEVKGSGEP